MGLERSSIALALSAARAAAVRQSSCARALSVNCRSVAVPWLELTELCWVSWLSSMSVSRTDSSIGGERGQLCGELGMLSDAGMAGDSGRHCGELGMLTLTGAAGDCGAVAMLLSSDSSEAMDCEFWRVRLDGLQEWHGLHRLVSKRTSPLAPLKMMPQQTSVLQRYRHGETLQTLSATKPHCNFHTVFRSLLTSSSRWDRGRSWIALAWTACVCCGVSEAPEPSHLPSRCCWDNHWLHRLGSHHLLVHGRKQMSVCLLASSKMNTTHTHPYRMMCLLHFHTLTNDIIWVCTRTLRCRVWRTDTAPRGLHHPLPVLVLVLGQLLPFFLFFGFVFYLIHGLCPRTRSGIHHLQPSQASY